MLGKKNKNPKDLTSRRAILWMHPQAVINMMKSNRWVVVENYLPEDATFHHVFYDSGRMVWGCVIQSADFKPVKIGEPMPELPQVVFKVWEPKDGVVQ